MQILVVEDERKMANLLFRALGEEGHQVVVAADGLEGFDIARSAAFDLIILDGMLPGMDGTAVARRLRDLRDHTPILMLTARDTSQVPGDVRASRRGPAARLPRSSLANCYTHHNSVLTLRISHAASCVKVTLEGDGPRHGEEWPFSFALSDAEDIRWYLESRARSSP